MSKRRTEKQRQRSLDEDLAWDVQGTAEGSTGVACRESSRRYFWHWWSNRRKSSHSIGRSWQSSERSLGHTKREGRQSVYQNWPCKSRDQMMTLSIFLQPLNGSQSSKDGMGHTAGLTTDCKGNRSLCQLEYRECSVLQGRQENGAASSSRVKQIWVNPLSNLGLLWSRDERRQTPEILSMWEILASHV